MALIMDTKEVTLAVSIDWTRTATGYCNRLQRMWRRSRNQTIFAQLSRNIYNQGSFM